MWKFKRFTMIKHVLFSRNITFGVKNGLVMLKEKKSMSVTMAASISTHVNDRNSIFTACSKETIAKNLEHLSKSLSTLGTEESGCRREVAVIRGGGRGNK